MSMFYFSEGGRKDKTKINRIFNPNLRFKFETHFINFFSLTRKMGQIYEKSYSVRYGRFKWNKKELTAEPYELGNSQVRF